MVGLIKKLLSKTLGIKHYLIIISRVYFRLYRWGKLREQYPENYLIQRLVKPGDHVIDLGANLGYYTIPISRIIGSAGKVWAVEPIPIFNEVLTANKALSPHPENITQLPYALGDRDHETITMHVPVQNGTIRHGLSAVQQDQHEQHTEFLTFEVQGYNPATLFKDRERVDFIKCDVEGYEGHIIPHLTELIQQCKPVMQIEISPQENRHALYHLLAPLGYTVYKLAYPALKKGANALDQGGGDYYFVPEDKITEFEQNTGLAIEAC